MKKRESLFAHPFCVSTSGQQKVAPFYEIRNTQLVTKYGEISARFVGGWEDGLRVQL